MLADFGNKLNGATGKAYFDFCHLGSEGNLLIATKLPSLIH